jgi:ubiquinone biosynthesis protein UbiJ
VAKFDLELLARQIEWVINEVAGLKDDVSVVLARLDRVNTTTHSLVVEVRAMHSRHERLSRRVDRIEERKHRGS